MGGRIDCYLDIASFYSYIAFVQILRNKHLFDQHSVDIEIHPVLLGGINAASGNKPPWSLPAKAVYGQYDFERAKRAINIPELSAPEDLMALAKTQVPLRALHYIKTRFPAETYLAAFHYVLHAFWVFNRDLTSVEGAGKSLSEIPSGFAGKGTGDASRPLFTSEQVGEILEAAGSQPCKDALKKSTNEALERGAFGCPWLWATNAEGKGEPFFGSDRWHYIYEFLTLPYQDVALLPPSGEGKPKL